MNHGSPSALPEPSKPRWQPLRIGLVDLFYYDYQEFWFRDGRLMLRGNNGTGKSKVLALTLPFLLDGDLSPSRVEPDGDRNKRMEWNLLLGGKYEERLGYAWLELGRCSEQGEPVYLTAGCGLKAVEGRGSPDRWFFVTSQRVGRDLFLIGPSGAVLTRERLGEALGSRGSVTQTAEQYRRMLDEQLFHLGVERYTALIELLLQLRQPQLSKRPSEERLSTALSLALPPIDQAVLSDISTAFHDLEQQRHELAALRDTHGHVERFLQRYRSYAQVAARRQAAVLRNAHAQYEGIGRELAKLSEQLIDLRQAKQLDEQRRVELEGERTELRATREELRGRAELERLDTAGRHFAETRATAEGSTARATKAEQRVRERKAAHARILAAVEKTRADVLAAHAESHAAAAAAGITAGHAALTSPLELPDGIHDERMDGVDREARRIERSRREAVQHLLGLVESASQTRNAARQARRILQEREAERDAAADRRSEAEERLTLAGREVTLAWRAFSLGLKELPDPVLDAVLAELELWVETLEGESPALVWLRQAAAAHARVLAHAHAAATAEMERARAELGTLEDERARLERGEIAQPPAPHTRAERIREERPGAPLWQLTDFATDVPAEVRARLEAGLEASGLLDAWITPAGALIDPDTHDVWVAPGISVSRNLGSVLIAAIDRADPGSGAVSTEAVTAALAGIGLGEQEAAAWVDPAGHFRLGPLRGAWSKPAAEYVGRGARDEARRRRLAQLADAIATAQAALEHAVQALAAIEARQRTLAAEQSNPPSDAMLRRAHSEASATLRELTLREQAVAVQHPVVARAEEEAATAERVRDDAAADLRLPAGRTELDAVLEALTAYRSAVVELVSRMRVHVANLGSLRSAGDEWRSAERDHVDASAEQGRCEALLRDARGRLEALRQALGATVEEIQQHLREVTARIAALDTEAEALRVRHEQRTRDLGHAEGRERELDDRQRETAARRDAAVHDFRRFAATGLLAVAVPDEAIPAIDTPWAADPAVRLARRAEQALAAIPAEDDAWERIRDEIARRYTELSEALTVHGHHAQAGLGDWLSVSIQFRGSERTPVELAALLAEDIAYHERLLTAKERELLEEHLVNHVASHLQELISDAEAQVERMNAELAERPTSTGMRLRLRWVPRVDAPPGLAEARARLLRQASELWSPEDRAAVGEFLQRQIEAERAGDEQGTWQEHLRRALDYRAWHAFAIERFQEGRWRASTGPASGGERVLTVSLPLFAAAAAHYRSAHVHAPRLVLLDEAFAGVDDDARAKCLGLLAQFDLDVAMTSEREWGFYATVPGIATHQLVRREGIDAVHVTTWEWDGQSRERLERVFAARASRGDDRGSSPAVTGTLL